MRRVTGGGGRALPGRLCEGVPCRPLAGSLAAENLGEQG